MGEDRMYTPVNALQGRDSAKSRDKSDPAARKRYRMKCKTFGFDCFGAIDDTCGDMNLVAGITGRAGHRKPMRQEIPILRHDVKEAKGACGAHAAAQRLCHA